MPIYTNAAEYEVINVVTISLVVNCFYVMVIVSSVMIFTAQEVRHRTENVRPRCYANNGTANPIRCGLDCWRGLVRATNEMMVVALQSLHNPLLFFFSLPSLYSHKTNI